MGNLATCVAGRNSVVVLARRGEKCNQNRGPQVEYVIVERDLQVAREVASRTLADEVNHRERNLKIVHLALVRLAKAVADGQVKMALGDLDKLIRLESFLRDEPDSRQEIVFPDLKDKSREELREMVRQEMEILKELEVAKDQIQP